MWNLLGAVAGTTTGNAIDSIFNKAAADKNYEYERSLQKADQEFQKYMRATAYQTTVEDMQKAGINPAVALSGGASQSQGGSSSHGSVSMQPGKGNIAETMMSLKERKTGIEQINANINNQTALTEADVELKKAQASKELKQAGFTDKQIEFYMKHGVFPGASTTKSISGPAGIGISNTEPIGLKKDKDNENNEYKPNKTNKEKYKHKWWTPEGTRERVFNIFK